MSYYAKNPWTEPAPAPVRIDFSIDLVLCTQTPGGLRVAKRDERTHILIEGVAFGNRDGVGGIEIWTAGGHGPVSGIFADRIASWLLNDCSSQIDNALESEAAR